MLTRVTGAIVLALASLFLIAGCHGSPAPRPSPLPTTVAEHQDMVKGKALIESCIPNGHTVVPTVLAGTASGSTYLQLAVFFVKNHGLSHVWDCIAAKPGPVPAPQMKTALETCGQHQVITIWQADRHWIRDRRVIGPAILNAAAVCAGRFAQ